MTASYILLTITYGVIVGPAVILAIAQLKNLYLWERILLGNILGVGLFIFINYFINALSKNAIISYLAITYLFAITVAIYLRFKKRVPALREIFGRPYNKSIVIAVGILLLITYTSRLIPLYFSQLPLGWDSAFHLILAKKIFLTNTLPLDWQPFDNITLNYPLGSHILVAGLSQLSGQQLHQSFKICFPIMAVLTAFMIYMLGLALFSDRRLGMVAAFSYSFLANYGGLSYYYWGGLPNMMGMLFLISALWAVVGPVSPYAFIWGGFFLANLYLTHHHSMFCVFIIICSCILIRHIRIFRAGKDEGDTFIKQLFAAFLFSLLITSFYLIPYFLKVSQIMGRTTVFTYEEEFIGPIQIIKHIGPVYIILAGIGFFILRKKNGNKELLYYWFASLFIAFVFFEYIYRGIMLWITGVPFVAFTPSRFLTNMAYPISFICAAAILEIISKLQSKSKRIAVIILVGFIALGYATFILKKQCRPAISWQKKEALIWIRENTPQNALIVGNPAWMPYLCWREGTNTPLPISEPLLDDYVVYKFSMEGPDIEKIINWAKEKIRPVYLYTTSKRNQPSKFKLVFKNEDVQIYKLE